MQCQISSARLPGVGWMALDVLQAQGTTPQMLSQ